jgi:hypothetical protein
MWRYTMSSKFLLEAAKDDSPKDLDSLTLLEDQSRIAVETAINEAKGKALEAKRAEATARRNFVKGDVTALNALVKAQADKKRAEDLISTFTGLLDEYFSEVDTLKK